MAAVLFNSLPQVNHFLFLTCLNINLKLLMTGYNQAKYVSKGTSLEYLPPLRKSSASLGKGWVGCIW